MKFRAAACHVDLLLLLKTRKASILITPVLGVFMRRLRDALGPLGKNVTCICRDLRGLEAPVC